MNCIVFIGDPAPTEAEGATAILSFDLPPGSLELDVSIFFLMQYRYYH
jgi:hypothetical protein